MLAVLAVVAFLNFALADLLPKMLFQQFPNRLCLALARPFRVMHLLLAPAVALVTRLADALLHATGGSRFTGQLFASREELRLVMQDSAAALTPDEQAMVNRVLDLQIMKARDLMVPLARATTLPADETVAVALQVAAESGFERLPVRDASGAVAGLVQLHDLLHQPQLDPGRRVDRCLRPALFLDEGTRLEEALQRLKRSGQRLAIVLDRQRKETGLLTLTDILRFLFGEVKR
jgi:CBS domain containing-hemolysin-like protein